jgi:hypothetical protein
MDRTLAGEQRSSADIVAYHLGTAWRPIIDATFIDSATDNLLSAREALTKPLTNVTISRMQRRIKWTST